MVENNDEGIIWSGSDLTYACLIDPKRTMAFKKAIQETVKNGDIVVDVGSGTGILAFFAAEAGAKKVYAVEVDPMLSEYLKRSIRANDLTDVIEVLSGDALEVDLPQNVDVVIAELIETGLLEEMQVKVMNGLRAKGVVGQSTKVIPQSYETRLQLVELDNSYYGYKIMSPAHDWPNYSAEAEGWTKLKTQDLTGPVSLGVFNFQEGLIEPKVKKIVEFADIKEGIINSLKLSGIVNLTNNIKLGPTNSVNGNKYIPIEQIENEGKLKAKTSFEMGTGLHSFKLSKLDY